MAAAGLGAERADTIPDLLLVLGFVFSCSTCTTSAAQREGQLAGVLCAALALSALQGSWRRGTIVARLGAIVLGTAALGLIAVSACQLASVWP